MNETITKNLEITANPEDQLRSLSPAERYAVMEEARAMLARTDFQQYCKYVHEWELEPHQLEWANLFLNTNRALVCAPPESGKSRVMRAFIEWTIGNNPNWACLLVQNTSSQASGQLNSIGNVLISDKYKKVFPHIQSTDRWSGEKLVVVRDTFRPDATVAGYGLRGPYQGAHVDTIVIDDPTDQTDVYSPPVMQLQKETVRGVLFDRLNKGAADTKLFVILTRWGDNDLVETFQKDLKLPVYTYPAYRDEPYPWGSNYLSSEYDEERIAELRETKGPDLFKLTFLCTSAGAVRGQRVFGDKLNKEEHLKRNIKYDEIKIVAGSQGVDYGTTVAHQMACVAAQKTADGRAIIRGAWQSHTGSSNELLDKSVEFRRAFGMYNVWIDRSQGSLQDQYRARGFGAYKGEANVEYRISVLLTLLATDRIIFDADGPGMGMLWEQLLSYARDENGKIIEKADDLVDALLYALCALFEPMKGGIGPTVDMRIGQSSKNDQPMRDYLHDDFNPAKFDDPSKKNQRTIGNWAPRV